MTKKVISLELAKELHEAAKEKGIVLPMPEKSYNKYGGITYDPYTPLNAEKFEMAPAYDCYELLEILPYKIKTQEGFMYLVLEKSRRNSSIVFWVGYEVLDEESVGVEEEKTPQEALGKLLLYLIQNNLY